MDLGAEFLRSVDENRRLLIESDVTVGKTHAELYAERLWLIPRVQILPPPDDLVERAARLEDATAFRDKQITHIENVRSHHGTQYNPTSGEIDIGVGIQVPKESEIERLTAGEYDGPPIAELVRDVDEYVAVVVAWVEDCFAAGAPPSGLIRAGQLWASRPLAEADSSGFQRRT